MAHRFGFPNSLTWQFASDGIEEFVGNAVYKPSHAPLLTAQWDRGLMRHPDPTNREPSTGQEAGFPYTTQFGSAWDISASPTDPDFLVAILDDHQDLSGQTVRNGARRAIRPTEGRHGTASLRSLTEPRRPIFSSGTSLFLPRTTETWSGYLRT